MLFRQPRVGQAGKPINMLKFRTMVHREANGERDEAITSDGRRPDDAHGGFLRRSRLDELPQIFNIMAGQMSWIGPRPEAEVLSSWYTGEIPFYRYRHVVRPGISGWAQVNQGHVASVDEVHPQAPVRLLLHQIFLGLARFLILSDDQDDADRVRLALVTAAQVRFRPISATRRATAIPDIIKERALLT